VKPGEARRRYELVTSSDQASLSKRNGIAISSHWFCPQAPLGP
jgi:hypothetical protein